MFTDRKYLQGEQYADAGNLNARIALHNRFSTNLYGWFRWVFDHLEPPGNSRLLELGCGPADLWGENPDRAPKSWEIYLSDFSAGMLQQAHRRLPLLQPNFRFAVIDAQAVPFPEGTFDAVIANHMLYHVPDMQRAFAEVRRTLKLEGRFFAATNGADHMHEIKELVHRVDPQATYSGMDLAFRLENGAKLLGPYFSSITIDRYEDALNVTEVEPLAAYILSMTTLRGITMDVVRRENLYRLLEQEIARLGAIHITKSACLFICQP
jgi:ubiquinone/menaquinone biosynthesis C-methylase UbiE